MKYIILIIFIIVALLFDTKYFEGFKTQHDSSNNIKNQIQNKCIEQFIGKPYIWIYLESETSSRFWKNFYSRRTLQGLPEYISLGIKTLQIFNKEYFNIQILTDSTLKLFMRKCSFSWSDNKINNLIKYEYVKYYLLYNYGGIWIKPDIIVFKALDLFYQKLNTKNMVLFNCNRNSIVCNKSCNPDLDIIGVKKGNKIIKNVLDKLNMELIKGHSNYHYNNLSNNLLYKLILKNKKNIFIFGSEYNGSRDYNGKLITIENMISNNHTLVKDPRKILFIRTDMKNINNLHKYQWISRLNKKQLLNSNMWISKLFRYALNKNQKYIHNIGIGTSDIKDEIYNIFPKTYSEFKNTTKNMNVMLHNPYVIVNKQSYRNC